MEVKITEEIKKVLKEGGDENKPEDYEDKVVNRIIGHVDKKGKMQWHTEDELKQKHAELEEILEEIKKQDGL